MPVAGSRTWIWATAGAQERGKGAHGGETAAPVDREDLVDQFVVQALQVGMRDRPCHAGRVYKNVGPPEVDADFGGEPDQRGAVGDIPDVGLMTTARQGHDDGFGLGDVTAGDDRDLRACRGELTRGRGSDAAGATGDDSDLAGQRLIGRRRAHWIGGRGIRVSPGSTTRS